jgi:hypothetical protein
MTLFRRPARSLKVVGNRRVADRDLDNAGPRASDSF